MLGQAWTSQVESACIGRGLQMTALRREIVGIFAEADQPLGAYSIIQKLSTMQNRMVAPPTVYRTLDFLVENGFVVKIESRQTYVACDHFNHHCENHHHGIVFSCVGCGRTVEVENRELDLAIAESAKRLAFKVERKVVEIEGRCAECLALPGQ